MKFHHVKRPGSGLRIKASATSRIRSIGNSKGVILTTQLISSAGIKADDPITIQASDGFIIITQAIQEVNTDLSTWGTEFKLAKAKNGRSEPALFKGFNNEFDETEW